MMAASNRVLGSKRPGVVEPRFSLSSTPLDLEFGEAWQDALDPDLPAEPTLGIQHADASLLRSRPAAHKLILMGLLIGAGLQALGYCGAAWLF